MSEKKEINSNVKNKTKNRSEMTYQEAFELIATHSEAFKMLPAKLKKDKVFFLNAMEWAVSGGVDSGFEYADNSLKKSRNFILKAVKIDGYVIHDIDEKFKKDKEIVLEALKRDKNAFQYVHESLKNDPDVLKLLKNKYGKTPVDPDFWS